MLATKQNQNINWKVSEAYWSMYVHHGQLRGAIEFSLARRDPMLLNMSLRMVLVNPQTTLLHVESMNLLSQNVCRFAWVFVEEKVYILYFFKKKKQLLFGLTWTMRWIWQSFRQFSSFSSFYWIDNNVSTRKLGPSSMTKFFYYGCWLPVWSIILGILDDRLPSKTNKKKLK